MKLKRKTILEYEKWIIVQIYWLLVFYLYYIIAVWGMQSFIKEGTMKNYLSSGHAHIEIILQSVMFGLFFNLIHIFLRKSKVSRRSFGTVILIESLLYLAAVIIAGFLVYFFFVIFEIYPKSELIKMLDMIDPPSYISIGLYVILAIFMLNFLLQVDKKFGPGNLFRLITGKYHHPREEERIFMFLDLENSTGIAEQLGHFKYSSFLRDCFHDLTDLLIKYRANVYQFVGDEVVLSWKPDQGLKNLNCIRFYFQYDDLLKSSHSSYLKKYNILPHFKAGMDVGKVTVAEIGDIKREIAYHGDVLNTAARLQEQCKKTGRSLLISHNLKILLAEKGNGYIQNLVGDLKLRGKQQDIKVYSLEQETQ